MIAPQHIYKPGAKQGEREADAYPKDWKLLDNLRL